MPELPEVEVVRLFLQANLLGHTITSLQILTPKSFFGNPSQVIGQKITRVTRIGKQLSLHLSNRLILLFHLKMTGQLIYSPLSSKGGLRGDFVFGHPTKDMLTQNLPNKSTRIIFKFKKEPSLFKGGDRGGFFPPGGICFFNDQRKFGWIKVFTPSDLKKFQSSLGPDLLSSSFTLDYFVSQLHSTSRPIKLVLLDQSRFSGIGNIYANDALFLAKIHPQTPSSRLSLFHIRQLRSSLLKIIRQSIRVGGSTAKDQTFIRPDGQPGRNQFFFRVYQRQGQPCPTCQQSIRRITISGRGTFFCPHCQPLNH